MLNEATDLVLASAKSEQSAGGFKAALAGEE